MTIRTTAKLLVLTGSQCRPLIVLIQMPYTLSPDHDQAIITHNGRTAKMTLRDINNKKDENLAGYIFAVW